MGSPASVQRYRRGVSTRGLILAALLCGLAILVAGTIQIVGLG
jgi:ABC-type Fe3+-siderophore transport system permease subunit